MTETAKKKVSIEDLMRGFVPVKERPWYPWVWPDPEDMQNRMTMEYKGHDDFANKRWKQSIVDFARNDFFFFCDCIMRPRNYYPLHVGLHDELCWLLQQEQDVGILVPRNTLKSTLASEYFPLWKLVRNQETRLLLASDTMGVAVGFLGFIRDTIVGNELFRWLFPIVRPAWANAKRTRFKKWNKYEMEVIRKTIKPEPSLRVMGMDGQTLTGMHFDQQIYDDMVTKDNANTKEKLKKVKDNYWMSLNLLDMGGIKTILGTRYTGGDIYDELMERQDVPFYVRKAVENKVYCWPIPEYIDRVETKRSELPAKIFASQYLNEIVAAGDEEIKAEWIKHWDTKTLRMHTGASPEETDEAVLEKWRRGLNVYLGCDPARTNKKASDYTAMLVVGVDAQDRKYVLEVVRQRMNTPGIVSSFIALFDKWNPANAKIETYGGDIHVFNAIKAAMKEQNKPYFRVGEYEKPRAESNEDRVRSLQTPAALGKIWIKKGVGMEELEYELLAFPNAKHDDLAVVLAYIVNQQAKKKAPEVVVQEKNYWRDRMTGSGNSGGWQTA